MLWLIDAARQKSSASVDLPIAGRAAMTIIWPGCRPLVSSSRSAKPVGHADHAGLTVADRLDLVEAPVHDVAERARSPRPLRRSVTS